MLNREQKVLRGMLAAFFVCCVISLFFVSAYRVDNLTVKNFSLIENVEDDLSNFYYGIDPIKIENEKVIVTGWVVNKNSDLTYIDRKVILVDEEDNLFEINTIKYDRNLTEFYDNGFNYDYGGIIAQCPVAELKQGKKYNVAFLVKEYEMAYIIYFADVVIEV